MFAHYYVNFFSPTKSNFIDALCVLEIQFSQKRNHVNLKQRNSNEMNEMMFVCEMICFVALA